MSDIQPLPSKTTYAFDQIHDLSSIPNQDGFQFIGVLKDNTYVECHVIRDSHGHHSVAGGATFIELKGWKYKPKK